MTLLITGGAGFIGSAIVRRLVLDEGVSVVNVDKLTYAGNVESLGAAFGHERHVRRGHQRPHRLANSSASPAEAVLHLAADTRRSIDRRTWRSS
jgi:dTDP-glucose 4,6-dehydratase